MSHPHPDCSEQSHAHYLQLHLHATRSILNYHKSYIRNGKSLRILEFALLSAIADLEVLDSPPETFTRKGDAPQGP